MRFFFYFVFWPFMTTTLLFCLGLMAPESLGWVVIPWLFAWIVWPIGTRRRRYQRAVIADFIKTAQEEREASSFGAVMIGLGPMLIAMLAALVGLHGTPVVMEEFFGIDVTAQLEEIQENVERERYQESP